MPKLKDRKIFSQNNKINSCKTSNIIVIKFSHILIIILKQQPELIMIKNYIIIVWLHYSMI